MARFGAASCFGVGQRERVQESRPARVYNPIADHRLDLLTVARYPLYDTVGLAAAKRRVEQHQLTHPRHAVMAGHHAAIDSESTKQHR